MIRNPLHDLLESPVERAVSPVIGVILMVAITVILAAVLGTFVLDMGQSAGNSAPQASLSVSTNVNADTIEIEHVGGEGLDSSGTRVIVTVAGNTETFDETATSEIFSVGETTIININDASTDENIEWGTDSTIYSGDGTATMGPIEKGNQITIKLIDVESQRVTFQTTITA